MELIQVGKKTYYIKNNTNIGVFLINEKDAILIDTGNDKDAGKKIMKIMDEHHFHIVGIINTHFHADHIGGNKVIQSHTNCPIYAPKITRFFCENTQMESFFLYGGQPLKEFQNKFICASSSITEELPQIEGLNYIELKGHAFDMIGIKTEDNVFFLGDALISDDTIAKYSVFYLDNVEEYLQTLQKLTEIPAKIYIPSHGKERNSIKDLIKIHQDKIDEIIHLLLTLCKEGKNFEKILKEVFDYYHLNINETEFLVVGSTIKSYLSYLKNDGKITYKWIENQMIWETIEKECEK